MGNLRTGFACLFTVLAGMASTAWGTDGVYLEPTEFIGQSFDGEPGQKVLWLDREVKSQLGEILGHPYKGLRIRYWELAGRTAWILEEVGKVELITAGFVVEDDKLQRLQVLIYRETHGWEVRYPFFTNQFRGTGRRQSGGLDRQIDGISGATLSVNALVRLSEVALYLHTQSRR